MTQVLVTGGAGYIGSTLTRFLLEKGYKVRILDRLFFGKESLQDIWNKIEVVQGDIRDVSLDIFSNVDVVMDLAALSNDPSGELNPQATLDINYLGRARIAHLAKKSRVKRYILASSCSIYGFQKDNLTEKSSVNPLTTYAEANYLAERAALSLADDSFCVTCLRQATVFGLSHRMRFDLAINGMVGAYHYYGKLNVLRDGKQWRPFVHVKDTSRAFVNVMESDIGEVNKEIFNVGSNDLNIQILDLAKEVTKTLEKPFEFKWYGDPDKRSYKVSFDKINKEIGYTTKFKINDGIKEIWKALENKEISWEDPKTRTVNWYKTLLEWNDKINDISRFGKIF